MSVTTDAFDVWVAARAATDRPASEERRARVRQKLAHPDARLVVVRRADEVVGMVLLEPFRGEDGTGPVDEKQRHVSMVFVHPLHQRAGVGRELVEQAAAQSRPQRLSQWTREDNEAAKALYRGTGFQPTSETSVLHDGSAVRRWTRS